MNKVMVTHCGNHSLYWMFEVGNVKTQDSV